MSSTDDPRAIERLAFAFYPTRDVHKAVGFYQRIMGAQIRWWPDEHTALLQTPGAQRPDIMVEQDEFECTIGPGAVFRVESVDRYYTTRYRELSFVLAPCDIPPGRYAVYRDPDGNPVRIFDLSNQAFERPSFF